MKILKTKTLICTIAVLMISLINGNEQPPIEYEDSETAEVNRVVQNAYEGLSFTDGKKPDLKKLRNAFIEGAIFRSFRFDTMQVTSIEEYLEGYGAFAASGAYSAIVEKELWGETQVFGKVAHRLSTYALYYNDLSKEKERGVNSMQLVKTKAGWKITSVIYDTEKERQVIPKAYLKR